MIPGLKTKTIGCLVADGSDAKSLASLRKATVAAGASLKIVAPKIGGAIASDGTVIEADFPARRGVLRSVRYGLGIAFKGRRLYALYRRRGGCLGSRCFRSSESAGRLVCIQAAFSTPQASSRIPVFWPEDDHKAFLDKASKGRIWTASLVSAQPSNQQKQGSGP